ncbi:MAG: hypothetical protein PHX74_02910 [Candidatus Sumerlaeales bacterium]|nr:hypothetical protein [Candidatus Sumerlaeales bacterium]
MTDFDSSDTQSSCAFQAFFTGHYFVKIDKTLRVTIPSKFVQVLDNIGGCHTQFVWVIPGVDGLRVLPKNEWDKLLSELNRISPIDRKGQEFKRFMLGRALECELDVQNRIRLTKPMMAIGKLTNNELAFTGAGNEMSIETVENWEKSNTDSAMESMWQLSDQVFSNLEANLR